MQSLSLSMRSLTGFGLLGQEAKVKRRSDMVVVACASDGDSSISSTSSSSFLSRTQTYALLKQQMEVAAKSEVSLVFFIPLICKLEEKRRDNKH